MKAFTQQEKNVILFLTVFFAIGIIVVTIRNGSIFSSQKSTLQDKSKFKSLAKSVYDDNQETKIDKSIAGSQGLININEAEKDELITLPKIGPVTAERIIRYREDYGKFSSVNELKNVKGIGDKTMEKILSLITIEFEEKNK